MPSPLLMGGIELATQATNAIMQGVQNRAQRKWNEKMYDKQRADALTDWNAQNAYNSPLQQMQRLKDAGLNPNLVYGNGANAQSAAPPRATDSKSWQPTAPRFSGQAVMGAYYDTQVKQAQIDNLKTQNTVLQREAAMKEIETLNKTISANRSNLKYGIESELRNTSVDIVKQRLKDMQQGYDHREGRFNWAAALHLENVDQAALKTDLMRWQRDKENPAELAKLLQSIVNMKQQVIQSESEVNRIKTAIKNAEKDGTLKDLIIELKKIGLDDKDPAFMKMIGRFLSNL